MDSGDLIVLCENHGINIEHLSPKHIENAIHNPTTRVEKDMYEEFMDAFCREYGSERGKALVFAISVLIQNRESFKRKSGTTHDSWFAKDTFHPIAQECADALDLLPKPKEWQVRLKQRFESFA